MQNASYAQMVLALTSAAGDAAVDGWNGCGLHKPGKRSAITWAALDRRCRADE